MAGVNEDFFAHNSIVLSFGVFVIISGDFAIILDIFITIPPIFVIAAPTAIVLGEIVGYNGGRDHYKFAGYLNAL
jgi:hypothetical protein